MKLKKLWPPVGGGGGGGGMVRANTMPINSKIVNVSCKGEGHTKIQNATVFI